MEKYQFQTDNKNRVVLSMITALLYSAVVGLLVPIFGIIALVCIFTHETVPLIVFICLCLICLIGCVVLLVKGIKTFKKKHFIIDFDGRQMSVKSGSRELKYSCSDITNISADCLDRYGKGYITCTFQDGNEIKLVNGDKDFAQAVNYFRTLLETEGKERFALDINTAAQFKTLSIK